MKFHHVEVLSKKGDLREAAANLFSAIRRLDALNLDLILAESVPEVGLGRAIMDRLRRASHPRGGIERNRNKYSMKKVILALFFFLLLSTFYLPHSIRLPAEDVQLVTDAQYFQVAKKMIQEAKSSIQVMMFEMGYYDQHPNTPSNLLIKELIDAKKRGV